MASFPRSSYDLRASHPKSGENLFCNLERDVELSNRMLDRTFAQLRQQAQPEAVRALRVRNNGRYCPLPEKSPREV